jgi:hypothetical protein
MVTTENGQIPQVSPLDVAPIDGAVQQALAQLRGVYQFLPDFAPATADGLKAMPARTVSDEFLEACAVVAENDTTMQLKTGLDPVRTRLVIHRNLRYQALATEAEALVRDIRFNMCNERWEVVQQALQVYNLAKGFTRNARADSLLGHVKTMKSTMGRNGKRGKLKTAPAPLPVPQKQVKF